MVFTAIREYVGEKAPLLEANSMQLKGDVGRFMRTQDNETDKDVIVMVEICENYKWLYGVIIFGQTVLDGNVLTEFDTLLALFNTSQTLEITASRLCVARMHGKFEPVVAIEAFCGSSGKTTPKSPCRPLSGVSAITKRITHLTSDEEQLIKTFHAHKDDPFVRSYILIMPVVEELLNGEFFGQDLEKRIEAKPEETDVDITDKPVDRSALEHADEKPEHMEAENVVPVKREASATTAMPLAAKKPRYASRSAAQSSSLTDMTNCDETTINDDASLVPASLDSSLTTTSTTQTIDTPEEAQQPLRLFRRFSKPPDALIKLPPSKKPSTLNWFAENQKRPRIHWPKLPPPKQPSQVNWGHAGPAAPSPAPTPARASTLPVAAASEATATATTTAAASTTSTTATTATTIAAAETTITAAETTVTATESTITATESTITATESTITAAESTTTTTVTTVTTEETQQKKQQSPVSPASTPPPPSVPLMDVDVPQTQQQQQQQPLESMAAHEHFAKMMEWHNWRRDPRNCYLDMRQVMWMQDADDIFVE
ncbi:hypothetical protein BC940DRAFT_82388 [Gongronella butleri]|nr:hypothetical protein BC940DRAFT_82388 [Gongronella butleri]